MVALCRRYKYRCFILITASAAVMFLHMVANRNKELTGHQTKVLDETLQKRQAQLLTAKHLPDDNSKPKQQQACVQPKLDMYPSNDFAKFFAKKFPKPACSKEKNWVYTDMGTFRITEAAKKKYRKITCDYVPIMRGKDDFSYHEGERVRAIQDGARVPAVSDVAKVSCSASNGKYENHHVTIPINEKLQSRSKETPLPKGAMGLNVLMFGFDSVSRLTWMRKLPKTYDYMMNTLKSIVLEGYNIVGDGTSQALLPILTGQTEQELPEARRGKAGAKPVDGHPWVWNNFKESGYVTQWADDAARDGAFMLRMLGFAKQPVDHYITHYYLSLPKNHHSEYCLGSEYKHNVMLKWLKDFYTMYKNGRKFSFGFNSQFLYGDNSPLSIVDEDLKAWLESLNNEGYLNNTMLILMSDHGARFANLRETVQGKQEERNPFFSFSLPEWFQQKYPSAFRNLLINSKRLTTPFDIHETFLDVVSYRDVPHGDISKRGISLFSEIPAKRTCEHAQIEPHWCNCLNWTYVKADSANVKKAAKAFTDLVNSLLDRVKDKCHLLEVDKIIDSVAYAPSNHLLKFNGTTDVDGRHVDMSAKTKPDVTLYHLKIHTKPGGGHFEATVKHDLEKNIFNASTGEVSRTNKYGNSPACVAAELPHLRPLCYCRDKK